MRLHLPKPLHGWRAFAGEVGIIGLGVLIALGAEQSVQTLHARTQINEDTALRREVADHYTFAVRRAAQTAWQSALAAWPRISDTPRQTAVRASLLAALGRTAEAKLLTDRLSAIGTAE